MESEVLDFKRWEGAKKSLSEAVVLTVCFANAEGGLAVFGVKDRVKGRASAVMGCERYDLDIWRRGIYESTRPHLTVDISELAVPEGKMILVRVPKGPAPPYGTAAGFYQVHVGKNCVRYFPEDFQRRQVLKETSCESIIIQFGESPQSILIEAIDRTLGQVPLP